MPRYQYPSQRFQDWLSQRWVMLWGRRVDPKDIPWLMGPYGEVDVIGDDLIQRLARDEALDVEIGDAGDGVMESVDAFGLDDAARARLHPAIAAFYERTSDYELHVWSSWSAWAALGGRLIARLFSRRLQQLNLPLSPLDTARGMRNQIVLLRDQETGDVRYRVWLRRLEATGHVIYSGIYDTTDTPNDGRCVKVVFPLPRGNATVVMRIEVGEDGALTLTSSGRRAGDAGFYFLLRDKHDRHYRQYIRSFRERIHVYVDDAGVLRADHVLTLCRLRVLSLHYRCDPRAHDNAALR